jgi:hypothetical protein
MGLYHGMIKDRISFSDSEHTCNGTTGATDLKKCRVIGRVDFPW